MTAIGDILNEFFSPVSRQRLWVMPENDSYTRIVQQWTPVMNAVKRTRTHLRMNCSKWIIHHMTYSIWTPTMTDAPKPGAHRDFVASPPGTDPQTCQNAFIQYVGTAAAASAVHPFIPVPVIQTTSLYTCSIGSFNLYTTVDQIDCTAKTATIDIWMYNNMSRRSFGQFANNLVFSASGMQSQYMWWNWKESLNWSSGTMRVIPRTVGSRGRR